MLGYLVENTKKNLAFETRIRLAEGEIQYDDLERRLAEFPVISVPTITLEGDANGAAPVPARRSSPANMTTVSSRVDRT